MLTEEQNATLTAVGPKTPMGTLLRRYWLPIAAAAELDDEPVKAVRVLGEDLVLFKDGSGSYGLVDRRCPHRGADLAYGMPEECGLRCSYHGWLFDREGRCLAQPFEERANAKANFKDRVRTTAYPVSVNAGLVWAYLGPQPAPAVPNWRNFHTKAFRHVAFAKVACNWLQIMENSFDQTHNEWLHDKWPYYLRDGSFPNDRWEISKFEHREFDYGWTAEVEYAGKGQMLPDRIILFPNGSFISLFEFYVPIDDRNTLIVYLHNLPLYADAPFKQARIPYWFAATPPSARNGTPRDHDLLVFAGQGAVADRTKEHLAQSDRGVIMFRRKLLEQIEVAARGEDPKGVVRDPNKYFVKLPLPVPSGPSTTSLGGAVPRSVASREDFGKWLAGMVGDIDVENLDPAERTFVRFQIWKEAERVCVGGLPQEIRQEIAKLLIERGEPNAQMRLAIADKIQAQRDGVERRLYYRALERHGLRPDEDR